MSSGKHLEVSVLRTINDWSSCLVLGELKPDILRNQAPDVLKVEGRTELVRSLGVNMVVP